MRIEARSFGARQAALVFCVVFGIAYGFALYTHHAWEDYYITYRCSKNLATGQGLVFTPGERVHAFTSPLNTLIPAALSYVTGNRSDWLVLWMFRMISCAALAGGAVLLYRIARAQSLGRLATFTWIGMFATLPGIVDFSINGQETGLMMFFLAMALESLMVPGPRVGLRMGLAWAGLMWTRPDSCVYVAAIAGAFWLFNAGSSAHPTRLGLMKTYLAAGAIAAVLYAPWVVWAWSYFGSPVPHTVIAKGLDHPLTLAGLWQKTLEFLGQVLTDRLSLMNYFFAPPYAGFAHWPMWMFNVCRLMAWLATIYWIFPFPRREGRALSLAFLVSVWYVTIVTPLPFPWYLPNAAFFGVAALGLIVEQVSNILCQLQQWEIGPARLARVRTWVLQPPRLLLGAGAIAIPAFTVMMLVMCAIQMRVQQQVVERSNRMQIGLWLRANARSPQDSVFLEPLGYIGFFSQLKMYDWPGLCSPEVVAARRRSGLWSKAIAELKPDWLVFRPGEVSLMRREDPRMLGEQYVEARVFDVSERLKPYAWIPGHCYAMADQTFTGFRRRERLADVDPMNQAFAPREGKPRR